MNEREKEELLYRLDERTERLEGKVDNNLAEMSKDISENRGKLSTLDDRVQKNETILTIMTGGLGSVIAAFGAKFAGLIHLKP